MELKIEKYAEKQSQLQEQVKELFAKNNILENKISVLNECLSLDKIKKKISELENKQKLLTSLESMVSKLKTDVKQLDYLKQILQRQLMVSSLSTTDINIGEQTNSENSQLTVNSGCAIETLDSLSDVDSEESIMVLTDYDVVADEDVLECSEKPVGKKVLYSEALLMASSVHSLLPESLSTSIRSNVQSNQKDVTTLMNTSSMSEKFLKTYDVVNKQDLLSNNKSDKTKLKCDTGKDKSPVLKLDQSHVFHEELNNSAVKPLDNKECDYVSSLVDSWIKVNKNKLLETLTKTNLSIDKIEGIAKSQKYNKSETNAEVKATHLPTDQSCNNQFVSKNYNIIKSGEHICNDMDFNNKVYNPVLSTSIQEYEFPIKPLSLNIEDINIIHDCNKPKVNADILEVPINVQNDRLCNKFESKELNKIKNFENLCNYEDCNDKNVIHKSIYSANVTKSELSIKSSLLKSEDINVLKECGTQKGDVDICEVLDTPTHVQNDKLCNTFKPDESCENSNRKNKVLINSLLFNIDSESSCVLKECNDLSSSINIVQSPHNNDETSTGSSFINECGDISLNVNILKGIQQHGYQNLTALQRKCLYHCMNGQDIIFYSYPCIGKSTMCIISVLERINTSLNECQAIFIVPTFRQALSTEKIIKSFGKFLDVSTCIGGTNVPRKVSPVPHVVVSTLQDLCDMIKFNSLCKDFIKILVFDDADELFKYYGLFNQIRYVLLFLNSNRQIIIGSSSRLEEILDQFSDVMQNPEYIIVPDDKPCLDDISQYYINVTEEWKFDAICELYEMLNLSNAVIYCNTWDKSLKVAEDMRLKTYTVSVVHNEMDTSQRRLILQQFQSCASRVLVTMELLKGEDFLDVLWVINYDLPKCPKEYVRRIVGCFKRNVKVINFITYDDAIAKENIEAAFNMQMAYFSKSATDLDFINDSTLNILEE